MLDVSALYRTTAPLAYTLFLVFAHNQKSISSLQCFKLTSRHGGQKMSDLFLGTLYRVNIW